MSNIIHGIITSIPEEFRQRQLRMAEESSREWFERLPGILETVLEKWKLEEPRLVEEMSFNNILLYASSAEYGRVVVKIGHPAYELFIHEPKALKRYGGRDACRLYGLDAGNRAMLLERLCPGEPLSKVEDREERIRIAAGLLGKSRRLWRRVRGSPITGL